MSFDALAPHYRWMELVLAGNKLQRCRTRFLREISNANNVLILGEGNGRFLAECRRQLPQARITCVDASTRMLALAQARVQRCGLRLAGIEFIHADALTWTPQGHDYDLIVTHFFLDCFRTEQLKPLVSKLAAAASTHARWLLADFQAPSAGFSRCRAQLILWTMYRFFRVATRLPARELISPDEFLRQSGFTLRERRVSEWGLLHSDLWERK
jgi:ubiquinone/menaquinone biosynthesis C-methylase UbiE